MKKTSSGISQNRAWLAASRRNVAPNAMPRPALSDRVPDPTPLPMLSTPMVMNSTPTVATEIPCSPPRYAP